MLKRLFASSLALSLLVAPMAVQAKTCRDADTGRYVKCVKKKPVRCRDDKTGRFVKCTTPRPTKCRDDKGRFTACTTEGAMTTTPSLDKATSPVMPDVPQPAMAH
ncbi:hypothetical protein CGLAMM_09770 [Acetobacteraceae bacterium EV16G]|uniref:Uncharacterized protein n=1 Tax=Sorlinia euscelidii TaxID=3081148 RepID=A0ABU7U5E1_9PROT